MILATAGLHDHPPNIMHPGLYDLPMLVVLGAYDAQLCPRSRRLSGAPPDRHSHKSPNLAYLHNIYISPI